MGPPDDSSNRAGRRRYAAAATVDSRPSQSPCIRRSLRVLLSVGRVQTKMLRTALMSFLILATGLGLSFLPRCEHCHAMPAIDDALDAMGGEHDGECHSEAGGSYQAAHCHHCMTASQARETQASHPLAVSPDAHRKNPTTAVASPHWTVERRVSHAVFLARHSILLC